MGLLQEVDKYYGKLELMIDGEWVDSKSAKVHEKVNPATGKVAA